LGRNRGVDDAVAIPRRTLISTGPMSVSAVVDMRPAREFARPGSGRVTDPVAEMIGHLSVQCTLEHPLGQLGL
jgi:hypothetical protein